VHHLLLRGINLEEWAGSVKDLDAGEEEKKKYGRADGAAASVGFAAPLCFFLGNVFFFFAMSPYIFFL